MNIHKLRCEYMENPIGLDVKTPRISWQLQAAERGVLQTAYQLQVLADEGGQNVIWDSGIVDSDQSVHVEPSGLSVQPRTRYYYRVQAWGTGGAATGWSDTAYWETGLMGADGWKAEWIGAPQGDGIAEEQSPYLRRAFEVRGSIAKARIYATALGLYELELNGQRVGESYFTPGWTSYNHRLQYQTYDVTPLVQEGGNAIGALLGKGWYSGALTWLNKRELYGDRPALLLQLHLTYADGREEVVVSDGGWKAAGSPILMSELYHGETYDARLERPGWSTGAYDDAGWLPVDIFPHAKTVIIAQENEPVRKAEHLKPAQLIKTPAGETVVDMGQNMVGWVRFTVRGKPGQEVMLEHAEVLDNDGNFYTENLRSAKQQIRYIIGSGEPETYEPTFTFQGFRYLRLTGFAEPVRLEDFTGVVLHSAMERTGHFTCSDPLVNQLQHNILWGQKGNFLDVPTDCPQRDERLGWTGDAQMFIRTATFLMNVAPFFTKWLRDLKADQREDGGVPFVIPNVLEFGEDDDKHSSAAWGDAAVICPWTLYVTYGDKRILEEQFESMKIWVEYIRSQGDNPYLWNTGFHFGDWLGLDSKPDSYIGATDRDLIATAFYAYSTSLVVKAAQVIGAKEDEAKYAELYENIVREFTREFVTPSGRLSVSTQTAQLLVLMFGLVDGAARERAQDKLMQLLEGSRFHLTTGFVGTPYLNLVLSDIGKHETACKLLFQTDYPSWLYQVTKGATTIWEHWDGIKEDGSFWSKDMNSFNHYAYGSIGDWLYRRVAGIDADEKRPGYKHIVLQPTPSPGMTWAEASLESMYGKIASSWKMEGDHMLEINVTVPANTTATLRLPGAGAASWTESEAPLAEAKGVMIVESGEQGAAVALGSGEYRFVRVIG
ncbi:family 78 glycoside hydrolase catalytic domain [Paenibacillus hamazuiensis]|uniref:family 78 glycoside hydrolase catalytic domain n=1 Tax=Paenibacillus hamazuiensis TaxID=2936508 RepID=UPI00200D4CB7|nr:family 78 glycoside hydrolase catalytic domain [Paenibacillus hamazuiensis]